MHYSCSVKVHGHCTYFNILYTLSFSLLLPLLCSDKLALIRENKTWMEAVDYCESNDMELVSVKDEDTQSRAEQRSDGSVCLALGNLEASKNVIIINVAQMHW